MNRRGFFGMLVGAATATIVAMWKPRRPIGRITEFNGQPVDGWVWPLADAPPLRSYRIEADGSLSPYDGAAYFDVIDRKPTKQLSAENYRAAREAMVKLKELEL